VGAVALPAQYAAAGHRKEAVLLGQKKLGGQLVSFAEPSAHSEPAEQSDGAVALAAHHEPAGQRLGSAAPAGQYHPASQSVTFVEKLPQYAPARHGAHASAEALSGSQGRGATALRARTAGAPKDPRGHHHA